MPVVQRECLRVGAASVSTLRVGQGGPVRDNGVVVLLHGIPTSADLWADVLVSLAGAGLEARAPDLSGYGRTRPGPGGDWSLAGAADLLSRWVVEQGLGRVWLVGHDAGGAVAQVMAATRPDLVSHLTLVNSIADGSWPAPRARFATAAASLGLYRPAAALGIVPNAYLRREIRRGFADPGRLGTIDQHAVFWDTKFSDADGRRAFQEHLAALDPADTARIVPGLAELDMPCQLVWGTQDPFQPWEVAGSRLVDILPEPHVTLLPSCGHFVPLECPGLLVGALLAWRAQVAA